jgi:bacillithiol system protein YtxJ
MAWLTLNTLQQIQSLTEESFTKPVVVLKHSTRCSISVMALGRLDRSEFPTTASFYLLDLLNHRDISQLLSETFGVHHESPQILIIKNGECVYDESHQGIRMQEIIDNL